LERPVLRVKQDFFASKDGKPSKYTGRHVLRISIQKPRSSAVDAGRIAHDWGYKYFKLDGLWTGMAPDLLYVNTGYKDDRLGETSLRNSEMTHVKAYREGLRLVRKAAGKDVFLLGCNVAQNMRTLGASFGLLDAMRIGPDNGRKWSDMSDDLQRQQSVFSASRVWYNDPDPVYVTDSVPLEPARALVSWGALTGQLNASSEDYKSLSAGRIHLLQRSMPAHGLKPRPVDLFEERIPRIWLLTDDRKEPRRDVVGLFNWSEKEQTHISCPAERIGLPKADRYVGFDYWADRFVEPFGSVLESDLPPASSRILAIRPVSEHPQVVSTSRHIAQGIPDLIEERWDEDARTLSGVSRVVAKDPYELRIAAMGQGKPCKAATLKTLSPDGTISLVGQDGWQVRIRIDSPCGGTFAGRLLRGRLRSVEAFLESPIWPTRCAKMCCQSSSRPMPGVCGMAM
jgi:hypothetical protein